jgi:hypothetical protein
MAKTQRPTVIVGGGAGSGGFSFKLNTVQTKNVQQVLGKTEKATSPKAASKSDEKKRGK